MVTKAFGAALGLTLATVGLSGCSYNEALGRNQLLIVDNDQLAGAAQQAWEETLRTSRVSNDARANARVRAVGQRLVDAAGLGGRSWQYVVFQDDTANAFVLPGGQIGVNTGLLSIVENDDQLAAVLGHEIAHMTANHAAERYSQTAATQVGLGVASSVLGGGSTTGGQAVGSLGGVGAQLGVLLPFSRRHELEADRLGVDYMARAGYRPSQSIRLWENMASGRTGGGGGGGLTSAHPSDADRIAQLRAHIGARGYS